MKIYLLIFKLTNGPTDELTYSLKNQMKRIKIIPPVLFLLLIPVSTAHGVELSLKFSGGLSYLKLGMINRTLQDWRQSEIKAADYFIGWTFIGDETVNFHSAFEFDGELIISFTPHLAVGIGAGFIRGELEADKNELKQAYSPGGDLLVTFSYIRPNKVSAFPLTLSVYYFLPLKKRLNLFIKGGGGIIWAKYIDREGYRDITEETFKYLQFHKSSAHGSIFIGNIGITYELEPGLRFFIEGTARRAKISGLNGENKNGEPGTLFYFEEYIQYVDFWQAKHQISIEEPSGKNFRSIQEAEVDFSGFSLKIGLIISF